MSATCPNNLCTLFLTLSLKVLKGKVGFFNRFWKSTYDWVVYLCFFITPPPYKMTLSGRHNACSPLLGTRERFTCWTRVSYLWLEKKGGERGKTASAQGWNMDTQIIIEFAHIQTEGAAYSTFHWEDNIQRAISWLAKFLMHVVLKALKSLCSNKNENKILL